jgi:hypothetical protein
MFVLVHNLCKRCWPDRCIHNQMMFVKSLHPSGGGQYVLTLTGYGTKSPKLFKTEELAKEFLKDQGEVKHMKTVQVMKCPESILAQRGKFQETKEKIRQIALSFGAVIATTGTGRRDNDRRTLSIEGIHCPAMNWTCCDLPAMMVDKIMEELERNDFEFEDTTERERNKWRKAITDNEKRLEGLNRDDMEYYESDLEDIKQYIARCKENVEQGPPACYHRNIRSKVMIGKVIEAARKYKGMYWRNHLSQFVRDILKPRIRWKIRLILPLELSV